MKRATIAIGVLLLASVLCAPAPTQPPARTSAAVKQAADTSRQLRVIVSLAARRLWVVAGNGDTLRSAPVAVGSNRTLRAGVRRWTFATPIGIRTVTSTEVEPVWIRPDWAYVELATQRKLWLDSVSPTRPRGMADGTQLVVRGNEVGILRDTVFESLPFDKDIVIGATLFMPPLGTKYRDVAGVLGHYRLKLGGNVSFHGTTEKQSIGKAVTHGCMRLDDDDIEWLYRNVPVGTPVFIF